MALRAQKVSGAFEKRAPGSYVEAKERISITVYRLRPGGGVYPMNHSTLLCGSKHIQEILKFGVP